MTQTITLVHQGHNRLRYLYTGTGAAPAITTTGAATPDLLTDTIAGPLRNLALAFANGYGKLPAGAFTQAQARALWLSDDPTGVVQSAGSGLPTAKVKICLRTAVAESGMDANVDGSGHPVLQLNGVNISAVTGYIDVEIDDAFGD